MLNSDQKTHWDEIHNKGAMQKYANDPTQFAQEVVVVFPAMGKVLELGCGLGNDSVYFAQKGYSVVGSDFSDVAVKQNTAKYNDQIGLRFQVVDMTQPFPFEDNTFDVVYARLSIHYFEDKVTKEVFGEIYRVLKPEGLICFVCKSTEDPLYGQGEEIEKDMYLREGHVRHFFSENYAKECLGNKFILNKIESGKEIFYGHESGFIKVVARKAYASN